jgi:hypothetical protein
MPNGIVYWKGDCCVGMKEELLLEEENELESESAVGQEMKVDV